ncbi:MAG TPA: thiamine-phosphate kinase [Pseudonocardiaceae bacterium]|nr:thiamine-phosphate kinase [Pseudonocardiaceae bacterium]
MCGAAGTPPDPPLSGPELVAELGEFGLIARVTAGRTLPPGTLLGPGDDAAVLAAADSRVVVTTDVLVDGVHFRLDWSTPHQVGRKAVAASLADVAAMGAVPTALVVGLAVPGQTPVSTVDGLTAGMWEEAGQVGAGIVGGDVVSCAEIVVSVTALGDLGGRAPVTRAGARAGNVLGLCGRLGWSAAGLAVLRRGFRSPLVGSPLAVVGAHRVPEPPYTAGPQAAAAGATAMIDISDGLLADAWHLAKASRVGIDIDSAAVPVASRLVEVAAALGADAQHWVLTGGEDHALLACFPTDAALPSGWTKLGVVNEGLGVTIDGKAYEGPAGWAHFES